MHTKAATPEDAELVDAIKVRAYAEYAIRAPGSWDEAFQRAYTKKNLSHTRLIYSETEVIGWFACEKNEGKLEVIDIHVLPAFHGGAQGAHLPGRIRAKADPPQCAEDQSVPGAL